MSARRQRTRLRQMRPSDLPAVLAALERQNQRDGTEFGLPLIWDKDWQQMPNVVLALVSADAETDEALQGWVFERTLELTGYGTMGRVTVDSLREFNAVTWLLEEKGYKDLHIQVPKNRVEQMERGLDRLMGVTRDDDILAHFYRLLDPAENRLHRKFHQERKREKEQ